jgi:transcriptional regulator with XRE-family HTH domain
VSDRVTVIQRKLAKAIRVERSARNISQQQLAERSNLSLNFIGRVERAEQMASIASVVQIAEALGMTADELLKKAKL